MTEATCNERVQTAAWSRLASLRTMMEPEERHFTLRDDGTMDTVIVCDGEEVARYSTEEAADYRDEDGALDWEAFADEFLGDWQESQCERFWEYGLSFEWKEGDEGRPGFHAYILSTGGPHEEVRFYGDASGRIYRVTFALLDWFDGAEVDITHEPAAQMLRERFEEAEMFAREGHE